MVNYGVSRACLTCKTRHIRCDEGRPKCKRCTKSKRTCLGYKDDADVLFRGYTSSFFGVPAGETLRGVSSSQSPNKSDSSPYQLSINADPEVREALSIFFSDYVLVSKDRSLSRGYFDGLEALLNRVDPDSELVRATKLVAFAGLANKYGPQDFNHRRSTEYSEILVAFQKTLNNPIKSNSDEALMTASLLGLYEMIVATEAYPDAHSAHIKGVSAILCTRKLPFDLLAGLSLLQVFNPLLPSSPPPDVLKLPGLLSSYCCSEADPSTKNLDLLLIQLRPILERASTLLPNPKTSKVDLRILKQDAVLLNKEFSLWPLSQPKEWMPQSLGVINEGLQPADKDLDSMPFWPGKVDSYFDLYVVAIWDTYRKARLKLLHVVAECTERLHTQNRLHLEPTSVPKLQSEMQELVDDLCSSIPFHLAADLHSCLLIGNPSGDLDTPGKALGGLLLMYPLYIASTLPLIPLKQRTWMQGRLRWIGKHMGIRQARMLADNDRGVSHKSIADGHTLLFAGSLIRPLESPSPLATAPLSQLSLPRQSSDDL